MKRGLAGLILGSFLFAAMPSSTDYTLHNYGFGSGGTSGSNSSNYSLNGISGETGNVQSSGTSYEVRSGNNNSQQADVPAAPSFVNQANNYDKLHFIINPGTSPSDTKFAIAISSDDFATTQYVRPDDTVGTTIGISNYQTYSAWGGNTGQNVTGLTPGTTYWIKVSALQGDYTNSAFGPAATASTVNPSITFSINTDSQSIPPFTTNFGDLLPATVTTATDKIWANVSTNADSGVYVYLKSAYAGLYSSHANYTIPSLSTNLSSQSNGYGAQGVAVTQASGGPLSIASPYNVTGSNVGVVDNNTRVIFASSNPITTGQGDFELMAKSAAMTPASSDYQDTLTVTAAAVF